MTRTRWLWLEESSNDLERELFGPFIVVHKGPGPVRLASEQETGLFARKALPPGPRPA